MDIVQELNFSARPYGACYLDRIHMTEKLVEICFQTSSKFDMASGQICHIYNCEWTSRSAPCSADSPSLVLSFFEQDVQEIPFFASI